MEPFRKHRGVVAPLYRENVDTDQIIPKQHLKRIERTGFGQHLFSDWRYHPDGSLRSDFVLNRDPYHRASILVAGKNFGCGSSREHAPIALDAAGIEAIVAEFYARIFYRNSINGAYLIPFESERRLCDVVCTGDELRLDVNAGVLDNLTTGEQYRLKSLGDVAKILQAGGIFAYARQEGMLRP